VPNATKKQGLGHIFHSSPPQVPALFIAQTKKAIPAECGEDAPYSFPFIPLETISHYLHVVSQLLVLLVPNKIPILTITEVSNGASLQ